MRVVGCSGGRNSKARCPAEHWGPTPSLSLCQADNALEALMAAVCRPISYVVLLVAILLCAASAAAQGVGGAIVGTVTDQTEGVMPGVSVTVTGPALMGSRSAVTAADGSYRLPNLPPGSDYIVVFELSGFSTFKREGIRLDVGFTATINATLTTAALEETVTVSGASPVVDVTASRVTTHLDAEQISTALRPLADCARDTPHLASAAPSSGAAESWAQCGVRTGRIRRAPSLPPIAGPPRSS